MEKREAQFTVFTRHSFQTNAWLDEWKGLSLQELIDKFVRELGGELIAWAAEVPILRKGDPGKATSQLRAESLAAGRTIEQVDGKWVARGGEEKTEAPASFKRPPVSVSCTSVDKFYDRMAEALGLPAVASVSAWCELGRQIAPCGVPRGALGGVVMYGIEATYLPPGDGSGEPISEAPKLVLVPVGGVTITLPADYNAAMIARDARPLTEREAKWLANAVKRSGKLVAPGKPANPAKPHWTQFSPDGPASFQPFMHGSGHLKG